MFAKGYAFTLDIYMQSNTGSGNNYGGLCGFNGSVGNATGSVIAGAKDIRIGFGMIGTLYRILVYAINSGGTTNLWEFGIDCDPEVRAGSSFWFSLTCDSNQIMKGWVNGNLRTVFQIPTDFVPSTINRFYLGRDPLNTIPNNAKVAISSIKLLTGKAIDYAVAGTYPPQI
jgi:hypothetical protein